MIFLDNAATSFRKPKAVYKASVEAMHCCASAGRGGYGPSSLAAETLFDCRTELADLYGMDTPERVAFTSNATVALNMAIKGIVPDGGHVVTSGYEHNAVMRPLTALERRGVTYTAATAPLFAPEAVYEAIARAMTKDTSLVVINHVSNVFGFIQPVEEIDELCARKGVPLIVDASQSAGLMTLAVPKLRAAVYLCMPGHKSLYGPQGTGAVIACPALDKRETVSMIEGGTGSDSASFVQPSYLPDLLESGTHNVCGIAGLCAGIRFVKQEGVSKLRDHGTTLTSYAASLLSRIGGMKVFHDPDPTHQLGVLSFVSPDIDCTHMAALLAAGGFAVRAGHHCAPLAHRSAGTFETGTVRVSPSAFTTPREIERFCEAVRVIIKYNGGKLPLVSDS